MNAFMYAPNVALVELHGVDTKEITAYLHCSIPGGYPQFSFTDPRKPKARFFPVVDAPQCNTLNDIINFCKERFDQ